MVSSPSVKARVSVSAWLLHPFHPDEILTVGSGGRASERDRVASQKRRGPSAADNEPQQHAPGRGGVQREAYRFGRGRVDSGIHRDGSPSGGDSRIEDSCREGRWLHRGSVEIGVGIEGQ